MPEPEQILDPRIQSAIRRVRGGHVADPALRARIAQTLDTHQMPPASRPMMSWVIRGAIAASLLIGGGVLEHFRHKAEERREYLADNQAMLQAMVLSHDGPPASIDQAINSSDPAAIQAGLGASLSRPIPLPDLRPDHWELKRAGTQPLHGAIVGRIDFVRDERRVTLLSLPLFAFKGADDGFTYDIMVDQHPISGFATATGIHCIIGDKNMPPEELTALRKRLQQI
jgi:hypothetical protein